MSRLAVLLIALAGFQDASEIDRWIADLAHEEIARRDVAQGRLLKAGVKSIPALKKLLESKDRELSTRARLLIEEIERPAREAEHDRRQRTTRLELVTLEFKDARLADVQLEIEKQLGVKFKSDLDPESRVTLSANEAPIRKVYDAIEDQLDATIRVKGPHVAVTRLRFPRKPRAYAPGATVDFSARPFKVDGTIKGIRIRALEGGSATPFITSWEVRGAGGAVRSVEQCKDCGPNLALALGGHEELRIRLKGRILWTSVYVLEIKDPEISQSFRVGPYSVRYEFPKVTITSPEEIPYWQFGTARLEGQYKEGRGPPRRGIGGRFGALADPPDRDPDTWCDCEKGPKPLVVEAPATRKSRVESSYEYSQFPPSDFQSMKILFYKGIEEPFDVDVVIPAD